MIEGKRSLGKVAVFSTCYVNYNEPGIGHDLLKLLDHNEVPYVLVQGEACCGMPKLELGNLDAVEKYKERNIPLMFELAEKGYAILTPVPSCTLMFKSEIPLLFADDPRCWVVANAMVDPFEYLVSRNKDGQGRAGLRQLGLRDCRTTYLARHERNGCGREEGEAASANAVVHCLRIELRNDDYSRIIDDLGSLC